MCNIAGYIGSRPAAPILLEMLKKQEGLAGGYYTGIATLHQGKIYCTKLVGDVDALIRETEAANLPGTVGIIHSRSKSGGGAEWSHPFLAGDRLAYVANGTAGFFKKDRERQNAIAWQLAEEGCNLSSRIQSDSEKYQRLPDGSAVHMSDVMAQLILKYGDMEAAFCAMPSEIVGLTLDRETPESIAFARVNYPMSVGFASHGAYLASAALAFPADAGEPQLLPANSSGRVWAEGFEARPFQNPPATVAPMDAVLRHRAFKTVEEALRQGECTCKELLKRIKPLFAEADCQPAYAVLYDVFYGFKDQLKVRTEMVDGVLTGTTAPLFKVSIKE